MLEVSLLGTFDVRLNGVSLVGLHNRHADKLLALLVLESNRHVRREWIESALDISHDVLRKAESTLRTCLGDTKNAINVVNNRVFLDTNEIIVDVFEFERLIACGDSESLRQAAVMYRGGLLKGWEDSWLLEKREELQENFLDSLQVLTKAAISGQDYERAGSLLRRFINIYPNMDSAWAQLLEVYRADGHQEQREKCFLEYLASLETRGLEEGRSIAPSRRIVDAMSVSPSTEPTLTGSALTLSGVPVNTITRFEPVSGAVPLHSPHYIRRDADGVAESAMEPQTSFILVKGPRQVGKTSLMARALQRARDHAARVLLTDWRSIPQTDMATAHSFLLRLAEMIVDQLELDSSPRDCFEAWRAPIHNFERFMLKVVFPAVDGWMVWGIDEADRLFDCDYKDDIFGMLRSWHNRVALDPGCEWKRLTIVITYATDAYLVQNINQSPFNVGYPVNLTDFTLDQVIELNARYGSPLHGKDTLQRFFEMVGGHPYLVRRSLLEITLNRWDYEMFEVQSKLERGPFYDHLERMRLSLVSDEESTQAVIDWLCSQAVPTLQQFVRLCAAGVMTGSNPVEMQMRCGLYEQFLRRVLL